MPKLSPMDVSKKLSKERDNFVLVDVRSEDEFQSGHVPGATSVPLDKIESGQASLPEGKLLVLSCQSGRRSARACEVLQSRGINNIAEMDGGFSAWVKAGLPVSRTRKAIPVMRQVMITAGMMVLIGSALSVLVHPLFLAVPIFVGAGLTFAGVSGWCGLAFLLERMPWNRTSTSLAA